MKRLMTVLVSVLVFMLVTFDAQAALAFEAKVVDSEICPPGSTYVTFEDTLEHRDYLCGLMGSWYIARIADQGSMDGPGYGCGSRKYDDRSLGNALCKPFKPFVVDGESCPPGSTYVTYEDTVEHRDELCGLMGSWYIARIADQGSMDGPGYKCKSRPYDERSLGNALCK